MTNQRYYSPSAQGFFSEATHGARKVPLPQTDREIEKGKRPKMVANPACLIPADAKPISDEAYQELFAAQAAGKAISFKFGKPRIVDHAESDGDRTERNRMRRARLLRESDWASLPDTLFDQPLLKQAWLTYRQKLRDLDCSAELADADWPAAPLGGEGVAE